MHGVVAECPEKSGAAILNAALRAGIVYFAAVFALGFVLGTVRVVWLLPAIGALPAVAIELPIMLGMSWWICARVLRRFVVPETMAARAVMGGTAFVLLMLAEFLLATLGFGQSPGQFIAGFREPHAVLGLLGQIGFALMPSWQRGGTID